MKEFNYNGTKLVVLSLTDSMQFRTRQLNHCAGCYFFTGDELSVVENTRYPSKQVNPDGYACDRVDNRFFDTTGSCFCIPKDYYERHKPK